MNDVTIVAGGWSVKNIAVDRLCGTVVAVNDAAIHLPSWHHAVSMDRLWTEYRLKALLRRAAEVEGTIWLRRSTVQNVERAVRPWPLRVKIFDCDHRTNVFDERDLHLNGTNSGCCALNLAFQLKPQRIFLLGFDFCRSPDGKVYWYEAYPWAPRGSTSNGKYAAWAKQLEPARAAFERAGIQVFNVSPGSAVNFWPKWTPAQYLRECR